LLRGKYQCGEGRKIWWIYFINIYENMTVKPVEIVQGDVGE
jgi:hypothetical protein